MKADITKKMRGRIAGAFMLIMSLLFSIYIQNADAIAPQIYIDNGEQRLYTESIDEALEAYNIFLSAKSDLDASDDPVINFYLAFTRMLYYAFTGDPIGVEDLMGRYGVSRTGDDEYTLQYDLPLDENDKLHVPGGAPTGETVRAYINNDLLNAVDESISNLDVTLESWTTASDKHIAPVANTGRDRDLEIDYGDILLFRACLKALKSLILIASAYDLDINLREIAALENLEALRIKDILDRYQEFLTLLPDSSNMSVDGSVLLDQARLALIGTIDEKGAIDDYLDASYEILNDLDTEEGAEELTEIDECDRRLEDWARTTLMAMRDSLTGEGDAVVDIVNKKDVWEFTDDSIPPNYFRADFDLDMSTGDYNAFGSSDFVGWEGEITCVIIEGDNFYLELEADDWPYNEVIFDGTITGDQISGDYSGWSEVFGVYSGTFTATLNSLESETEIDSIDLNPFFGNGSGPYDVRDFLPDFDECDHALVGTVGHGFDPPNDATIGGIFPYYDQSDWKIDPEVCTLGDATINGNLSVPFYSGEGTIFIQAFRYNGGYDTSPDNRLGIQTIYADEFTEGMPYEIPYVQGGSDVFVSAWWDLNSNGIFDPGEAEQIWGPDYIPSGSTITADFTLETGFTVLGSVINIRQPGGGFQTLIEVAFGDDFTGNLPDDIDSITIEAPSGPLPYGKDDLTYHTQFEEFYIFLPGSPEIGIYTFTVTGGGLTGMATDHQYNLRTFPLQDTTAFSPAAGTVVSSKTPTFEWDAVEYDSDPSIPIYYRLEICEDDGGAVGQRVFATGRVKDMLYYTLPTDVLTPGGTYWWRVRVGDSNDWIRGQNRVISEWIPFTVADPLSPHSNQPAIDPDGWGVASWTYNFGQTGTDAWVKIYDHDGVASDGSSHSVTIQTPANPEPQPMYFVRSDGPGLAAYEFWSDNPPLSGVYTFRVEDPDGNFATITETLDPGDVLPLDPLNENSITPSVLTGSITAAFDDIYVRKDGALELYEDFNSYYSIDEIDWNKWSWNENASIQRDNGNGWLVLSAGNSVGRAQGVLSFADPQSINEIRAEITVTDINEIAGSPRARIRGTWCNNGIGDIGASLSVNGSRVYWSVGEEFLGEQETWQWTDGQSGDLLTGLQVGDIVTLSISLDGNDLIFSADGPSGLETHTYTVTNNLGPPINPEKSLQTRIHLFTSTTPTFSWNAVGANRYRVRIYNHNNSRTIWRGYTGETSYTVPPGILKPNSFYRFRIEARDAHRPLDIDNASRTPASDNYIFYTPSHVEADDHPFIDLSSNGVHIYYNASGSYLDFWIRVHDVQGVPEDIKSVKVIHPNRQEELLEYWGDNPFVAKTPTSAIYYLRSGFLPVDEGTYTFVVEDNAGHRFQIDEKLIVETIGFPPETSLSPVEGANLGTTAVNFSWDPVAEAAFYSIDIFDYDFNRVYAFHTPGTSFDLAAGFLKENTLYRWRVMPRNEYFSENVDNMSSSPGSFLQSLTFTTTPPVDTDEDGLPDWWEIKYGLDPNAQNSDGTGPLDPDEDPDGDGSTHLDEYNNATDPENPDTDGDGVRDGDDYSPLNSDESVDSDGDGLGDSDDPCPLDPGNDTDYDGLCYQEDLALCDPNNPDTDGDGVPDGSDVFCKDENEWADLDGDGIGDNGDNCPQRENEKVEYATGDSKGGCAEGSGLIDPEGNWQPDYDCDGTGNDCDQDADGDTFNTAPEGDDCDDLDENVYPGCPDTTPGCPCEGPTAAEAPPAGTCNANKDCDGDGVIEKDDNCPGLLNDQTDADLDGKGDACDNCNNYYNPDQTLPVWHKDHDNDGYHSGDTITQCDEPTTDTYKLASALLSLDIDCDDNNININPGAAAEFNCDPTDDPPPSTGNYNIKVELQRCTDAACNSTESLNYGSWDPKDGDELIVTFKAMDGNTELPLNPAVTPRMNSNFTVDLAAAAPGTFNPTRIPGKYLNDNSEDGLANPSPDFDNINFSTNQVRFTCRDFGGSITIHAEVPITRADGTTEILSNDSVFPKDSDGDRLPDFWESLYGNLIPTADPDLDGIPTSGEYRGVMWGRTVKVSPDGTTYDTVAYVPEGGGEGTPKHFRLDPKNYRDLFVIFEGFDSEYPFAVGEAFELLASKVAVHALGINLTGSLGQNNIDVTTVTLVDGVLGLENQHIDRWTTRSWTFSTLGKSIFGGDEIYGSYCRVFKKALDAFFEDKPHHDYTTFTGTRSNQMKIQSNWSVIPSGVLEAIAIVEDGNDNGNKDSREDLTGNLLIDGDHPVRNDPTNAVYLPGGPKYVKDYPGSDIDGDGKDDEWDFEFELSPFDINNNGMVELPVRGSVGEIEPATENSKKQAVKMIVTHELGHNVGITLHTSVSICAMNNESNNLIRDNHFSQSAAELVRIHNTPYQQP